VTPRRTRDPAHFAKFIVDVATGKVENVDPAAKILF
jgi:hypothetical protein